MTLDFSHRPVVVVVDNDPLMLTGIAAILDKAGYECHCARDRSAALKAASGLSPDLMVIDVELGADDGLDLCRTLRADPATADVPLLCLSGARDPEAVTRTQQAGADYYLAKPLDPNVLIDVVDKAMWLPHLLESRRGASVPSVNSEGAGLRPAPPHASWRSASPVAR